MPDRDDGQEHEHQRPPEWSSEEAYLNVPYAHDKDEEHELNDSVRVRLNKRTKKAWQDYVDDHPEHTGLSTLVRGAVAKEISGRYDEAQQDNQELVDLLLEIQRAVETVGEEVERSYQEQIDSDELLSVVKQAVGVKEREEEDG
ncbi:hypothetical protein [Halobaculum gomorrense]|uniref:Uncharacterized protein n=1 Tax=Halobaculum gomorrense TaxID=43928 RepID=A0A1M5S2U0_9EURY|nr:hypothetical protein [Halobaculum gomorrense]SHH32766.1 hypothetical protein SAMN05443636_2317 [Halobaculum gomorrense]